MAIFLGTGAAQTFPCPFCKCEVCEDARKLGGKAIKSRSDFLIDEKNLVDFGPDINYQLLLQGISMEPLQNIFMTHSHEDHISAAELGVVRNRKHKLEKPVSVNLWGTKEALEVVDACVKAVAGDVGGTFTYKHINYCPIEAFKTVETGGMRVTALLSSHKGTGKEEWGINYIFEKEGKTLLYAADTGWYPDDTWEFLKISDFKFDYVIMENTYAEDKLNIIKPYAGGHLNTANFMLMLEKLIECGCMTKQTPVYATHLSDAGRELYGHYVDSMENGNDYNITVAWDGLKIDF
ncbi:MAG: hypothetical protein J6V50_05900 [Clostridia bacterium]|nr:hypothetical protein [Clostridia bacterium]